MHQTAAPDAAPITHPPKPGIGPGFWALVDEILDERDRRRREHANVIWRAIMLAPTVELCEALLRGETVPISMLDPVWVKRFGLKDAA